MILLTLSQTAMGASVSGTVSDENGQAIAQSVICLSAASDLPAAKPVCLQTQTTNASGAYAFNLVNPGTYLLTIIDGRFPTFTWLPVARKLTLARPSDLVTGFNFKRQFSFSNFQKPVSISGTDLPELAGFNLSQDTVFVKVYAVDPANRSRQTVFFMGRVTSGTNLSLVASAPWTVREVVYEIFSLTAARQGSLFIQS
jgi:hypothetical protein